MVEMKPKCLIFGGADTEWHRFSEYRDNYIKICSESGYEAETSEDISCLNTSFLKDFSAVLCCASERTMNKDQETALLSSVSGFNPEQTGQPKMFLGVHSAAACFADSEKYLRMLGAKFLAHPPMGNINIMKASSDRLLEGIEDFSITDEFYLMEYYPPFSVLLEAEYNGFRLPLCWKKSYGLGTVCYLAPGHGKEQTSHPVIQRIIGNMLRSHLNQEV